MDKKLLDILVCPVSGAAVAPASADLLERVNRAIAEGDLRHADDSAVESPLREALVTQDQSTLYRVDDGIPVMLPELGIELPSA